MAVLFEHNDDAIRLVQTRRGMRVTFAVLLALATVSAALMFFMGRTRFPTEMACSHTTATCTLTTGRASRAIPVSAIQSVRLATSDANGHATWIWLREQRAREICGSRDPAGEAAAVAFATELQAFLADAAHGPIDLHCTTQSVNGPSPKVLLFAILGWLLVALLFSPFSHEITTTIDRRRGTIESKGRGWLLRAWDVKRPIADVERIDLRSVYSGRGTRRFLVYAVFRDGSQALLWSPAAALPSTIDERVAILRAAVAQ